MKIAKEKCQVSIICTDGLSIKGDVHINPGERLQDFINDSRKSFIVVTGTAKGDIILNRASIKWIEEA